MRGTSNSMHKHCSNRKTLQRCKNSMDKDNIVIIDVDSDSVNNVISIDVPESLSPKLSSLNIARKDKRISMETIICIDDDEDTDTHSGEGLNGYDGFDSDSCSSFRSSSAIKHRSQFLDDSGDGCQFVEENISPVKLSKCKRTYCSSASTRNRYGLSTESESDSSDNDIPDCVFVEDSLGMLHEQWAKASFKKKKSCEEKDRSPSATASDGNSGGTSQNTWPEQIHIADLGSKTMPRSQHPESRADFYYQDELFGEDLISKFAMETQRVTGHDGVDFLNKDAHIPQFLFEILNHERAGDNHANHGRNFPEDRGKCALGTAEQGVKFNFCHSKATLVGQCSTEAEANHGIFDSRKREQHVQQMPSCHSSFPSESKHETRSSGEMENLVYKESLISSVQPCNETDVRDRADTPEERVKPDRPKSCFTSDGSLRNSGVYDCEDFQQRKEVIRSESAFCNLNIKESQPKQGVTQVGHDIPTVQDLIIGNREKLKETDQYKQAAEEEWASRQRQLQIQAKEAQELRLLHKRKKAESLRLLDMEKRQKQRLEEVRESQKKDEENLNLKELLRVEVRMELSKLEMAYHDMASLLRGLGIQVGGGPYPLPNEVRAAYKRALLSFHPDRASKTDIREQVEAEEKFKLVSRMKEKFLLTS